ncbi:hypothetical protein IU460_29080 [Nocardia farcinica]|nr:hypothetical protein [Nocardia farcinica]MBF6271716.1 hypothetical protein [Nocardia farcinica]MCZ9330430.1 hypothetical protein [Nocardia farcinica]
MAVEEVGDPFAGNDDACLAVAGGEDAQAPCLKVEGGGIAMSGQRVHDDDNLEFATLKAVGGIDRDNIVCTEDFASDG